MFVYAKYFLAAICDDTFALSLDDLLSLEEDPGIYMKYSYLSEMLFWSHSHNLWKK